MGAFVGSFSYARAISLLEEVETASEGGRERADLERDIGELIDFHLLQRAPAHPTGERWFYHQSVREFAVEQASVRGELSRWRDSHATVFLKLAAECAEQATERDRRSILLAADASYGDVRAARNWLMASGRDDDVVALVLGLRGLSWNFAHMAEMRDWLEQSEPRIGEHLAAEANAWIALLAAVQADDAVAERHIARAWAVTIDRSGRMFLELCGSPVGDGLPACRTDR